MIQDIRIFAQITPRPRLTAAGGQDWAEQGREQWAAFVRRPGTMSTMSHRGPRHSSTLVTPSRWMSLYSELGLDLAKFCPSDWRWSDKSNWRWYQWMLDLRCQKNLRYLQYNIVNYETTYCIFCLVHKSFRLIKVPDQLIEIRFTWSFIVGRVSGRSDNQYFQIKMFEEEIKKECKGSEGYVIWQMMK